MPLRFLDYRIVKTDTQHGQLFMPQRGTPNAIDGIASTIYWRDAVPCAAPSLELAKMYIKSMREFDSLQSEGRVVWTSDDGDIPEPAKNVVDGTQPMGPDAQQGQVFSGTTPGNAGPAE